MDSKSYTLIKNAENSIFFIPSEEIQRFEPIHNAYHNGIRLTSNQANDYSLYNRDSETERDMKEAGSKIFGEAFKSLEYEELDEDEALPILNAFEQVEEWYVRQSGLKVAYYGGYEFTDSSWEGHIGIYEARLMDYDERIAKAQSFTGAEQVTTTSESNGYPKNLSVALIDFEDYEEAEECADRFGLCVSMFMQVDGWNLWSRLGAADSLLEWEAEDFGDDCFMFGPEDEEDFFETILQPRLQEIESCSEYKDVVDDAQNILNHIENLSTNEKVVIRGLNIVDELQIYTMRKHVDNNTFVIGVEPVEE